MTKYLWNIIAAFETESCVVFNFLNHVAIGRCYLVLRFYGSYIGNNVQ